MKNNPWEVVESFHLLIKKYDDHASIRSKVYVYKNSVRRTMNQCLYHDLNRVFYSAKNDTISISEEIIDDLMERGINDIIYTDYHEDFGWGDHISVSTTTFINEAKCQKGKLYLHLRHFEYLGNEYIPYIPLFNNKSDKNENNRGNPADVLGECQEVRQTSDAEESDGGNSES